jgi:hypothetical protein
MSRSASVSVDRARVFAFSFEGSDVLTRKHVTEQIYLYDLQIFVLMKHSAGERRDGAHPAHVGLMVRPKLVRCLFLFAELSK